MEAQAPESLPPSSLASSSTHSCPDYLGDEALSRALSTPERMRPDHKWSVEVMAPASRVPSPLFATSLAVSRHMIMTITSRPATPKLHVCCTSSSQFDAFDLYMLSVLLKVTPQLVPACHSSCTPSMQSCLAVEVSVLVSEWSCQQWCAYQPCAWRSLR